MPFVESFSRVYVNIVEGKFAVRSSEADAKAVKRELKSGHTIYERRYGSLTGKLKSISFKNQDFNGKQWEEMIIVVYDGVDHYQIQMPFPSNFSNSFLRAIPNVDLTKDIQFSPWRKVTAEKTKSALFLNQGGKDSVPWFYGTGDQTNGLPDLVPYKIPGSDDVKYSDVERNKFFKEVVVRISEKLNALWSTGAIPDASRMGNNDIPEASDITEPIDDLPF